jgi:hypothetical protein
MVILLQFILTTLACAALWRLWKTMAGRGKASLIIAAGFLLRALAGQILFWISWLPLPIARSLQLGNGFWFFAIDGPGYLAYADELIGYGPAAIAHASTAFPSHVFVQIFTVCTAFFGIVASVAILLNCAAYLATCAIITRFDVPEAPRLVALAAVAFGPGAILWSLQALKDTTFLFLITALVGLCYRWQELWRERGKPRWLQLLLCAAAMVAVIYCIAGFRWYFAGIACGACAIFFLLAALPAERRWSALAASAVLLILVTQAFRLGGDEDVPRWMRKYVDPRPSAFTHSRPGAAEKYVEQTRRGFETTPGATMIVPGPAIAELPKPVAKPVVTPPVPAVTKPTKPAVATPVSIVTKATKPAVAAPVPIVTKATKPAVAAPVPAVTKATKPGVVTPAVAKTTRPPRPRAPETPPPALAATLLTGSSAMFLPRAIAQALGLVRIGGGRGFWLFVELDTLVFDAVILFAIFYCIRARARITPLFVFMMLMLILTTLPMIYTVTNFGTLFRLRQMVYLLVALLPLGLRRGANLRVVHRPAEKPPNLP